MASITPRALTPRQEACASQHPCGRDRYGVSRQDPARGPGRSEAKIEPGARLRASAPLSCPAIGSTPLPNDDIHHGYKWAARCFAQLGPCAISPITAASRARPLALPSDYSPPGYRSSAIFQSSPGTRPVTGRKGSASIPLSGDSERKRDSQPSSRPHHPGPSERSAAAFTGWQLREAGPFI